MDCEDIKKIIPCYFQHTASEEEIKQVEEHLCVCHDCRAVLGELMDNPLSPTDDSFQDAGKPEETNKLLESPEVFPKDKTLSSEAGEDTGVYSLPEEEKVEYFPGESVENLMDAPIGKDNLNTGQNPPEEGTKISNKVNDERAMSGNKQLDLTEEKRQEGLSAGQDDKLNDVGGQELSNDGIVPETEALDLGKADKADQELILDLDSKKNSDDTDEKTVDLSNTADLSKDVLASDDQKTDPVLEESLPLGKQENEYLVKESLNSVTEDLEDNFSVSEEPLDGEPERKGSLDYIVLAVGLTILAVFIFLLLRG